MAVCGSLLQSVTACGSYFPTLAKNNVTTFAPKARRPTFGARLSTPDYPSYIFSISFVFLDRLLFGVISTVQWSGATSICDGIIFIPCPNPFVRLGCITWITVLIWRTSYFHFFHLLKIFEMSLNYLWAYFSTITMIFLYFRFCNSLFQILSVISYFRFFGEFSILRI